MRRRQKGFTLVELMVVVTIIGILAAIAFPRIVAYIRASSTAEASQQVASQVKAGEGYVDSQLQSKSEAEIQAMFDGYSRTASGQSGWNGHFNRSAYLKGQADLSGVGAGGYCAAPLRPPSPTSVQGSAGSYPLASQRTQSS